MGYVKVIHSKKTEYLTPEEFNDKLNYYENDLGFEADIIESGSRVIAHIGTLVFEANRFGTIDSMPYTPQIAKELYRLSNYHKLSEEPENNYGYTKKLKFTKYKVSQKVTWDIKVASGIGLIDETQINKPLKCWSYDLNSSFPAAMLKPMPDTRQKPRYDDLVGPNEMGFYYDGSITVKEGSYAQIIFPLIESPFKPYIEKYYLNKKNSTGLNRRKWKYYLNIPTGILALHNIFLRNAVVGYANLEIQKYIDDNTVYCNVDCIVSTKERTDLPIGKEIGMFKQEKYGDFKYKGIGIYQWGNEVHYQGLKGQYLTDISDISDYAQNLENGFKYKFNKETRRFERRENTKN